jgi:L-amino acid N-acyltransferase YncA
VPAPVETVSLPDGLEVGLRPVGPEDQERLARAYGRLGETSRLQRFRSAPPELSPEDLVQLTDVDHHRHEALVALDARGEVLGVARWVRVPGERDAAEVAYEVVDELQGRGLGTLLLERLAELAEAQGVRRLRALVTLGNERMVHLLARLGASRRDAAEDDVLEFELELPEDGARWLRQALDANGR